MSPEVDPMIFSQQSYTITAVVQRYCRPSPLSSLAVTVLPNSSLHLSFFCWLSISKRNAGKHLKKIQLRHCYVLCIGNVHKNWLGECIFNSNEEKKKKKKKNFCISDLTHLTGVWNHFAMLRSRLISPSLQTSNLRPKSRRLPPIINSKRLATWIVLLKYLKFVSSSLLI